jgi:eukaryotic-like serine/threonine-protein kinase
MSLDPLGRYEILQELGRGAMGVVYKARDPLIDRMVAIKSIDLDVSLEESAAFEHRFFREAKSAGRLNHINIVTIHDVGRSGDNAYIAMEFLEGRSLREIIDSGVVLPQEQIADIAAQVAEGLACAHINGVVHRDIKPANIMLLDSGIVKITDFGIALVPRGARTVGGVFGSPKYISPEQVMGKEADGRSDIFALGAVLYELLTGSPAFTASDLDAILSQVVNDSPPPPSTRNRNIGVGFDRIVAKAMAKNPDDRYVSADAMAWELRNYRNLEPLPDLRESQRAHERNDREREASREADEAPETDDAVVVTAPLATTDVASAAPLSRSHKPLLAAASAALFVVVVAAWTMAHRDPPKQDDATEHMTTPVPVQLAAAKAEASTVNASEPGVSNAETSKSEAAKPEGAASAPTNPAAQKSEEAAATSRSPGPRAALPPYPSAAARKSQAAPAHAGRLAFAVTPWGEVYVDGRRRGISPPLRELKLSPGKHVVEIRNTNFKRHSQTIVLAADASVRIKHKFQ